MSLKLKVSRGLKWQAISILGRQSLSMVVFAILARLLDPSSFGLVALVGVYSFFATMVADLGFGVALVQRKEVERAHLDTFFWFNLTVNSTIVLITLAFAGPLARLLGEPELSSLLRWSSLTLIIGSFSAVQNNLLTRSMDFRTVSLRTLAANATGGIVGVSMAFTGWGVWALVGQSLAGSLVGTVVTWVSCDYRPRFSFSGRHFRELASVGLVVFANSFIWFFASRFDQLTIGRFAGAPALGLYVIANKLPELLKSVSQQPLTEVAVPAMSSLQGDHNQLRSLIYKGMELNAVAMFAVYAGIASIAKDLVPLLFGPQWTNAAFLCSLLSVYALANSLHVFFYPALLASGVTGKYLLYSIFQALCSLIACIAGIQFGTEFLVLGLILTSIVLFVPAVLLLRARIGLSLASCCRTWLIPGVAAACMAVGVVSLNWIIPPSWSVYAKLVLQISLGAAIYLMVIYSLARSAFDRLLQALLQATGLQRRAPQGSA